MTAHSRMMQRRLVVAGVVALIGLIVTSTLSLTNAQSTSGCDPVVDHVEYTQSLQREDNSIPLIDRRPVTLRFYMRVPMGCPSVSDYDALVQITDGSQIHVLGPSYTGSITVDSSGTWDRGEELSSLNYKFLPKASPSSSAALFAITFLPLEYENTRQFLMVVNRVETDLDIAGVALGYDGALPDLLAPARSIGDAYSWALNPFRIGEGYREIREYYVDFHDDFRAKIEECELVGPCTPDTSDDINFTPVLAVETMIDRRDHEGVDFLYGFLPGGTWAVNGGTDRPGGAGLGNADMPLNEFMWIFAHEMGHWYYDVGGTPHPTDETDEYGWDVGFLSGTEPAKRVDLLDVMQAPGGGEVRDLLKVWLRDERYTKGLGNTQGIPSSPPPPPPWTDVRYVRGLSLEDPAGPWSLLYSYSVEQRKVVTPKLGGGGEIRVLDDQGGTLYSTTFVTDTVEVGWQFDPFSVPVPIFVNEDKIELYKDGVLQDSIVRSANIPQVAVLSPQPGQVLTSTLHVDWTATDADGDTLMASVLFSHDQERWVPLRTLMTDDAMSYDVSHLPSCQSCTVRVIVTDGMNTEDTDVGGLEITSNRLPIVRIVTPYDGESILSSTNVIFHGVVSDQEDGVIFAEESDLSVSWTSSIDGVIGYGTSLNFSGLSAGTHTVTLTASDSDGGVGNDAITVTVIP